MLKTFALFLAVVAASSFSAQNLSAQIMPPQPDQQLAHDIYKEFIEIKSGYTTGATTPVAEAAAKTGGAVLSSPLLSVSGWPPESSKRPKRRHLLRRR